NFCKRLKITTKQKKLCSVMKYLFLFIASWLLAFTCLGQSSPQYIFQPPATSNGLTAGGAPLRYPGGSKIQSMYKPGEFPGITAGTITAVYLQASTNRPYPISFRNMTVKMCHLPVN